MIHGHQGVGDGRDDSVASATHCSGQVENCQAGGVEDGDGHGDGEQAQTQLVGSLQTNYFCHIILEEHRIQTRWNNPNE